MKEIPAGKNQGIGGENIKIKEKSGILQKYIREYQRIFKLFHNFLNHRNDVIYDIKKSLPFKPTLTLWCLA